MRLIDVDSIKNPYENTSLAFEFMVLKKILDDAPTVDAVEIVRCKDCKFRDKCHKTIALREYDKDIECSYARFEKLTFCSYGERKEE